MCLYNTLPLHTFNQFAFQQVSPHDGGNSLSYSTFNTHRAGLSSRHWTNPLLQAVRFFRDTFRGNTPLFTDHQPLLGWFNGMPSEDNLPLRWGLLVQEYDLALQYLPGCQNSLADSLSRIQAQFGRGPPRVAKTIYSGMKEMSRTEVDWPTLDSEVDAICGE